MRFFLSLPPRILIGLLTALFLIIASLMLARHLLLENSEGTASSQPHPPTHPSPPVLPSVLAPKSNDEEATTGSPPNHPSAPSADASSNPGILPPPATESLPARGQVRVLPPIQAEPDEDEVVEWVPDGETEPPGDDTPEEEAPPPMLPELSPDFVR